MGTFISNNDLYDVWRCHHTTEHDYTFFFFSHRHNSYSQIDYFLVDKWLLPNIPKFTISTITWADHAPATINIDTLPKATTTRLWRANASNLQSPTYATYLRERLEEFFTINNGSISDSNTLWNTHKAFIRGILIKIDAREKRKRGQSPNSLTSSIKELEKINQSKPDPRHQNKSCTS